MQFANYAAFRQSLQAVLDGDDISQSAISTATLDLIVSVGEQRLYREVKSSTQDTLLAATVTANVATLPSDCLELKSVYFAAGRPLQYMPYELIEARIQLQSTVTNNCNKSNWYSLEGDNLVFWPEVTDGTIVNGRYRKRFADIAVSGIGSNTFFTRWPDLWLYAALAESGPYLGERERLPEWKERYVTLAASVSEQETRRATRGSKLSTRRK